MENKGEVMFKNTPIIGIMPLYDKEKDSYWMIPGYMKSLEEAGAIPMMLPLTERVEELNYFLETCDGFLLTGGQDVTPELYGEERKPVCGETSALRDSMDKYIFTHAVQENKVILGICRGIQLMNAVSGGTLYQDLPSELESDIEHHMQPPYDRTAHMVDLVKDSPIFQLLQEEKIPVNSYHHQGVKVIGKGFQKMAVASDGLVEGIYMPDKKFVWGIQWHPEFSYKKSSYSQKIIEEFVTKAKES